MNAEISKNENDDEDVSTYRRIALTEEEEMINDFFRSVVLSDKRFFLDPDENGTKMLAIKIEDICDYWREFREKWESKDA